MGPASVCGARLHGFQANGVGGCGRMYILYAARGLVRVLVLLRGGIAKLARRVHGG